MAKKYEVKNEYEFGLLMESVDKDLQKKGLSIEIRPLHAVMEVANRLGTTSPVPLTSGTAISDNFEGGSLSAHIHNWYEAKYGERLKVYHGPGSVAILIKGEAWRITFPEIIGQVKLVCDPDIERYKNLSKVGVNGQVPLLNVLRSIENITPTMARTLSRVEIEGIFKFYCFGLDVLQSIESISEKPYAKEAKVDLTTAVDNILTKNPHFGISKYASLQFTEKIIKSKLAENAKGFPKEHKLKTLAGILEQEIGIRLNHDHLDVIQCSAGAQYGEETVDLEQAILAHHKSLKIFKQVYPQKSFEYGT